MRYSHCILGGKLLKKQIKADFSLFMVTLVWGSTFVLTKYAIDRMPMYNFLAIRFAMAFIVSLAIFHKRMMKINREVLKYGVIIGIMMFFLYAFQTAGLLYTTASKSAFITGMTVIMVPVFSSIIIKRRPERKVAICTVIAFIGVGLISLNGSIDGLNIGDILTLISAFTGAIFIILVGKYTVKVDSVVLAIIQFAVVSITCAIVSLIFENPVLPPSTMVWADILFLSVVCTAGAFIVQNLAQKFTSPTHVALIFAGEPVFAAIFGYVFIGELLSVQGRIGAALIVFSMLLMEIDLKQFFISQKG
jgi:drug/metabolite transporter (DMT)-like permease